MRIQASKVRELAELARLELSCEELARMQHDLDAILGYVELLGEADTEDVPPTTQPLELETALRPDEVEPPLPVEAVVRGAPAHEGGALLVPKVIE